MIHAFQGLRELVFLQAPLYIHDISIVLYPPAISI